jgi:hypothetical protein
MDDIEIIRILAFYKFSLSNRDYWLLKSILEDWKLKEDGKE